LAGRQITALLLGYLAPHLKKIKYFKYQKTFRLKQKRNFFIFF